MKRKKTKQQKIMDTVKDVVMKGKPVESIYKEFEKQHKKDYDRSKG